MENSMHNSRLCVMAAARTTGTMLRQKARMPGKTRAKRGGTSETTYSAGAATVLVAVTASDLASPYRNPATTT